MKSNKILPHKGGCEAPRRHSMWKVFVNCEMLSRCQPALAAHGPVCLLFQRRVQDVISPIVFEAAYSLGEHVTGEEEKELPALTPVLRWKKGQKIAQKNQVRTWKHTLGPEGQVLMQKSWSWMPGRLRPDTLPDWAAFPDLQK